jgi:tetratricopeptide (TPR) repeat protein
MTWLAVGSLPPPTRATGAELAAALVELGLRLSQLGRYPEAAEAGSDEALAVCAQALAIRRQVAADGGMVALAEPARTLQTFGLCSSDLHQTDDAVTSTAEAVAIRRRLADAQPDAYRSELAHALWAFAEVRAKANTDLAEARAVAQEACVLFDALSQHHPGHIDSLRQVRKLVADLLE